MSNSLLDGEFSVFPSASASTEVRSIFFSILRAIYEICLKRAWAVPAKCALSLCKMVERRMWVKECVLVWSTTDFSVGGAL